MSEFEIIRGTVEGKEKYCRIPLRSKTGDLMQNEGIDELSSEKKETKSIKRETGGVHDG